MSEEKKTYDVAVVREFPDRTQRIHHLRVCAEDIQTAEFMLYDWVIERALPFERHSKETVIVKPHGKPSSPVNHPIRGL